MKVLKIFGVILLLIVCLLIGAYLLNIPLMEVAGEPIGFADIVNFFFSQAPQNLQEVKANENEEIGNWFNNINGSEAIEADILKKLGSPIKLCVFKDANYCDVFKIEDDKIFFTNEPPKKTLYISYNLSLELKEMAERKNYENVKKRLVQAIKNGEVKGLSLEDVNLLSQ
jgi:hypothetical protein